MVLNGYHCQQRPRESSWIILRTGLKRHLFFCTIEMSRSLIALDANICRGKHQFWAKQVFESCLDWWLVSNKWNHVQFGSQFPVSWNQGECWKRKTSRGRVSRSWLMIPMCRLEFWRTWVPRRQTYSGGRVPIFRDIALVLWPHPDILGNLYTSLSRSHFLRYSALGSLWGRYHYSNQCFVFGSVSTAVQTVNMRAELADFAPLTLFALLGSNPELAGNDGCFSWNIHTYIVILPYYHYYHYYYIHSCVLHICDLYVCVSLASTASMAILISHKLSFLFNMYWTKMAFA